MIVLQLVLCPDKGRIVGEGGNRGVIAKYLCEFGGGSLPGLGDKGGQ